MAGGSSFGQSYLITFETNVSQITKELEVLENFLGEHGALANRINTFAANINNLARAINELSAAARSLPTTIAGAPATGGAPEGGLTTPIAIPTTIQPPVVEAQPIPSPEEYGSIRAGLMRAGEEVSRRAKEQLTTMEQLNAVIARTMQRQVLWATSSFIVYRALDAIISSIRDLIASYIELDRITHTTMASMTNETKLAANEIASQIRILSSQYGLAWQEVAGTVGVAQRLGRPELKEYAAGFGVLGVDPARMVRELYAMLGMFPQQDLKRLADTLTRAWRESGLDLNEFINILDTAAPAARQFGMSLQELIGFMAGISRVTGQSGNEMERLVRLMRTIYEDEEARRVVEEAIGRQIVGGKGEWLPLDQLLRYIAALDEAKIKQIALFMPGALGQPTQQYFQMIAERWPEVERIIKDSTEATGEFEQAQAEMLNTVSGQWERLKDGINGVLTLFLELTGAIDVVKSGIKGWADVFSSFLILHEKVTEYKKFEKMYEEETGESVYGGPAGQDFWKRLRVEAWKVSPFGGPLYAPAIEISSYSQKFIEYAEQMARLQAASEGATKELEQYQEAVRKAGHGLVVPEAKREETVLTPRLEELGRRLFFGAPFVIPAPEEYSPYQERAYNAMRARLEEIDAKLAARLEAAGISPGELERRTYYDAATGALIEFTAHLETGAEAAKLFGEEQEHQRQILTEHAYMWRPLTEEVPIYTTPYTPETVLQVARFPMTDEAMAKLRQILDQYEGQIRAVGGDLGNVVKLQFIGPLADAGDSLYTFAEVLKYASPEFEAWAEKVGLGGVRRQFQIAQYEMTPEAFARLGEISAYVTEQFERVGEDLGPTLEIYFIGPMAHSIQPFVTNLNAASIILSLFNDEMSNSSTTTRNWQRGMDAFLSKLESVMTTPTPVTAEDLYWKTPQGAYREKFDESMRQLGAAINFLTGRGPRPAYFEEITAKFGVPMGLTPEAYMGLQEGMRKRYYAGMYPPEFYNWDALIAQMREEMDLARSRQAFIAMGAQKMREAGIDEEFIRDWMRQQKQTPLTRYLTGDKSPSEIGAEIEPYTAAISEKLDILGKKKAIIPTIARGDAGMESVIQDQGEALASAALKYGNKYFGPVGDTLGNVIIKAMNKKFGEDTVLQGMANQLATAIATKLEPLIVRTVQDLWGGYH